MARNKHLVGLLRQRTLQQVVGKIVPIVRTLEHYPLKSVVRLHNPGLGEENMRRRHVRIAAKHLHERVADHDRLHLVGVVIVEIHHLYVCTEARHFVGYGLLEAHDHTHCQQHHHHPDDDTYQRYTHRGTRSAAPICLLCEIQAFRYPIC